MSSAAVVIGALRVNRKGEFSTKMKIIQIHGTKTKFNISLQYLQGKAAWGLCLSSSDGNNIRTMAI